MPDHAYAARLVWDGDAGHGTSSYAAYGRQYRVLIGGKPDLVGSADPAFRGDAGLHNPEDLFLAALSSCHMLSYLALCARHGVCVRAYEDEARGTLRTHPVTGGAFEAVVLSPWVTVEDEAQVALAVRLHETAHEQCFIANSYRVPLRCDPTVVSA